MIIFWLIFSLITLTAMSFLLVPLIQSCQEKPQAYHKTDKKALYLLLLLLPIVAYLLYLKLGANQQVAAQQHLLEKNTVIREEIKKLGSLQHIILKLKEQVEANPDSEGWSLLGRLYFKAQQFKEASHAFAQANQLTPNQVAILIPYAESLYFANQAVLTPQAKQLLQQVLHQQPNQPDVLDLLARDAYQKKEYTVAIGYWEQLLSQLQPGSEEQQSLLQLIAQVQQKTKLASMVPPIQLTVYVTLSQSLRSHIQGDEVLFIYAKAINGPSMPLAIVRKQAKDLPLKITLDESMAMTPSLTLSSYGRVKITARISRSGQAIPVKGDLMGSSLIIDVARPPDRIDVSIDKEFID